MKKKFIFFTTLLFVFLLLPSVSLSITHRQYGARETNNYIIVVSISGEIDYGVQELIKEAIARAEEVNGILIIVLDTPGGLLDATFNIISLIRTSKVPVVGYVYPPGKGAWSAGTLILLACHVAAMAPGTIIGSLQPVYYNPATGEYTTVNESKIINPVLEMATTLARDRGRNVSTAQAFVLENLNLDAEDALKFHIIEFIARSLDELIQKLNGYTVTLDNGETVVLNTKNAKVEHYSGSLRTQVIRVFSDPVINGLIGTLGILLLIIGVISGHYVVLPLAIGLIILSLLGAGYNANYISLTLMLIGAIALAIELVTPRFGILGFSGIILIALGIALMPYLNPSWFVSPEYQRMLFWTGITTGIVLGAFMGFVLYKIIQAKRKPPVLKIGMVGLEGKCVEPIEPGREGFVLVQGEYWRARSDEKIDVNEKIVVVKKDGAVLIVKKKQEST